MHRNITEREETAVERWSAYLLRSASYYADTYTVFGTYDPTDRQQWLEMGEYEKMSLRNLAPFLQATWLTQLGQPNKALISGQRPALYYIVSRWSNWALGIRSRLRTSSDVTGFAVRFDTPATAARILPRLRSMNLVTTVVTDGVKGLAPTNMCLRNAFISGVTFNVNSAMASEYVGGPGYHSLWKDRAGRPEAETFLNACFKEYEQCFPRED